MTTITVTDITRQRTLAQGELGQDVFELEGSFYFPLDQVDRTHLVITARTYTCPYKGVSQWIDLLSESGTIRDVAWVYTRPSERFAYLQDQVGFAFGMRPGVMVIKR